MAGILDNPDAAYAKLKEMGKGLFGPGGGLSGLGGGVGSGGTAGGGAAGPPRGEHARGREYALPARPPRPGPAASAGGGPGREPAGDPGQPDDERGVAAVV